MKKGSRRSPADVPGKAIGGQARTDPFTYHWHVPRESAGMLLDDHLATQLAITREEAADLVDFGSVQIDGRREASPARKLSGVEEIQVHWPWQGVRRFYEISPERIIYRDRHLLAYDKEAGVPSQQTPADAYNNLFAALQRYMKEEKASGSYVAMHHRLDQETSGVMIFSLDSSVNKRLGASFESRSVAKDYLAWVQGGPDHEEWTATDDISRKGGRYVACPAGEGKTAETTFRVLERGEGRTLLLARPKTGRTHQIRLHLEAAGHPVLGDRLYGGPRAERLFLHAWRLRLPNPVSGKNLILEAPIPPDWPLPRAEAIPD